jgi:pimeloyl-ACP methyl ester carboxylesterase
LPVSQGEELHRSIPGSQFRTIPDAGHLVQHDAPATLAVEISSFLQAAPA